MTPPSNAGGEGREVLAREGARRFMLAHWPLWDSDQRETMKALEVLLLAFSARENADDRAPTLVEAAVAEMRKPFVYKFGGVAYGEADMAVAQRAACAIVPLYGTGDHGEQEAAKDGRLWNDHPAVQGALRALHEAGWSEHQVRAAATSSQEASNVG